MPWRFSPGYIQMIGAVGSGKSELFISFVLNLDKCFSIPPTSIYVYYEKYQLAYSKLPSNVHFFQGLPDSFPEANNSLIVLDDLGDMADDVNLYRLASVHSRLSQSYVISVKHDLFLNQKYSRNIAVSTQYYILLENLRHSNQIKSLARQVMPTKVNYFIQAYTKAVDRYGYVILDLTPRKTDRLLSDILAETPAVFVEL